MLLCHLAAGCAMSIANEWPTQRTRPLRQTRSLRPYLYTQGIQIINKLTWNCVVLRRLQSLAATSTTRITWIERSRARCLEAISASAKTQKQTSVNKCEFRGPRIIPYVSFFSSGVVANDEREKVGRAVPFTFFSLSIFYGIFKNGIHVCLPYNGIEKSLLIIVSKQQQMVYAISKKGASPRRML